MLTLNQQFEKAFEFDFVGVDLLLKSQQMLFTQRKRWSYDFAI